MGSVVSVWVGVIRHRKTLLCGQGCGCFVVCLVAESSPVSLDLFIRRIGVMVCNVTHRVVAVVNQVSSLIRAAVF